MDTTYETTENSAIITEMYVTVPEILDQKKTYLFLLIVWLTSL